MQLFQIITPLSGGALVVWSRRSLATLEDRSSILRAGNNNVGLLVTKSDWPTLVGSVCYASLVTASADRDIPCQE